MKIIVLISALVCTSVLCAHDFVASNSKKQALYFNVIDAAGKQVEVTYQGDITSRTSSPYAGEIEIPSTVKNKSTVYCVTRIGKKAFSEAAGLKGIVMPSGLNAIDDFAFEGCTQLEKVVFPGNQVRLGEGVFFRCTSIDQVTLGSDWTTVNLKIFRWSERLTTLYIPAKLVQVQNMKSLKGLVAMEVDANNPRLTAIDGILYTKDLKTLLGCPRAHSGKVTVTEGTTLIRWGAFIDCLSITKIDLPASLKVLSYNEFSRLKALEWVVMRSEEPVLTANDGTKKVFLLRSGNDKAQLVVPASAKDAYKEAICSAQGEHTELSENLPDGLSPEIAVIPLKVEEHTVFTKKNIVGVKNFSKYNEP